MIWLIIGIILTIVAFVGLGLDFKKDSYGDIVALNFGLKPRQVLSLLCLSICLLGCFTKIPANHVGIIYSPFGGTKETTLNEGFAKKSPLDKVYKISTETQTKTVDNLTTQTKDAQYVISNIDVKYKVNESNAYLVFKQYRTLERMSNDLIISATQRVLEHITTKYNVIDILGEKRSEIYAQLEVKLAEELEIYGVQFVSITINDMDAGEKLEAAIEAEAVAKKEVETAEQQLLKAETEAKQKSVQAKAEQEAAKIEAETKIIEAEAERKANELLNKSLSEEVLQQQWIAKWNGQMPSYYGGDAGLMIGIDNE